MATVALAQNLAHQALVHGRTVLFTTAGQKLGELAALDSDSALRRRLHRYATPDLLFELVSRRYETKSTVVTTNKTFSEWSEVIPNAACVVSLVDRLLHNSEVIAIEGKSYRLKEAKERSPCAKAKVASQRNEATIAPPAYNGACRFSSRPIGQPSRHWRYSSCSPICAR